MKLPAVRRVAACLGLVLLMGCDAKPPAARKEPESTGGNPATAPLDYLAAQGRAYQSSVKVISLAQLQQTVQQFYGMEERWPRDLQELVTKRYLTAMPAAPAGFVYTYDARSGQVRAVSAGAAPAGGPRPAGGAAGVLQRARQLPGAGGR